MVGIFTGSGSGLERGSAGYLGAAGLLGSSSIGRGGDRLFVNAATGNIIVQQTDEVIVGRGPDAVVARTYNSLGDMSDENGDNWRMSTDRRIYLTGTANTAGSSARRVSADGTETIYSYDSSRGLYSAKDVDRAEDTLTFGSGVWTWKDGATQIQEKYSGLGAYWRFSQQIDTDGNTLTFTNPMPNVLRVTTADGGYVNYHWAGNNLTKLVTGYIGTPPDGALPETSTWYQYDTSNRLMKVTVDHSPQDNSTSDGNAYWTAYEYHDASRRIKTISQSDGSKVEFEYHNDSRVFGITQTVATGVTRRTEFTYGTESGSAVTTIKDAAGENTKLHYDGAGRLVKVSAPPLTTGATPQTNEFTYGANGDVESIKDALGNVTTYTTSYQAVTGGQYRIVTETDPLNNVVTRTYGLKNELLREQWFDSDAAPEVPPHISRYVYDSENHLRFAISAAGRVTEYRYTGPGAIENVVEYPDPQHGYTPSDSAATITEANMVSWRDGLADRSSTMITYNEYDVRGNLFRARQFAAAGTSGLIEWTGEVSRTDYSYDQAGQLLSRAKDGQLAETFVYDGLGRIIGSTDLNGGSTTIAFHDAATKTTVTLANGLVQTSTYNKAGELLAYTEAGASVPAGETQNRYDQLGRLRVSIDATGFKTYFVYDKVGRLVGEVRHAGQLTEYRYDAANRLVGKLSYFNSVSSATLEQLGDPNSSFEMSQLRPAFHDSDVCLWQVYDANGRLTGTVDGTGSVTAFHYDKSDRLVKTIVYANRIDSLVGQYKVAPPTAVTLPAADAVRDSVARSFYDGDGLLIALLDGEGYIKQFTYDRARQKVGEFAYARSTDPELRVSGTLAELTHQLGTTQDRRMRYVYDGRGYLRYAIDRGANLATEYVYNGAGQVTQTIRYAGNIGQPSKYTVAQVKNLIDASGLASSPKTARSFAVYDNAGRVAYSIDAEGAVARYGYDNRGQVVLTVRYAVPRPTTTAPDLTTMESWKDGQEGNAGNRSTRNYWSARGELRFAVDGENHVTEMKYDAAGRVTHERRWDAPLPASNSWTVLTIEPQLAGGTFAETRYGYDWGGAVTDVYNGADNQVEYNYDGNLVLGEKRVVGGGDASVDRYLTDGAGRVRVQAAAFGTTDAAVTTYTYDSRGNLVATVDARANGASRTFDRNGRLRTETDAEGGLTSYEYNAFGELVKVTDPRDNSTWNYYDVMGRLVATRDAEGFLTETTYTAFGQPETVTRRYLPLTDTPSTAPAPAATPHAKDATTHFEYDRLGRLVKTTDAETHWEQYTLDAFGDRIAVRNKLGGTVYNQFDKRGLLVAETLPMASYNLWGQVYSTSVTNRFEYDARGNLTKKIEAWLLPEQRTTSYFYDRADRLIETRGDPVLAVGPADYQNPLTVTPTEYRRYDLRGRLSETVDALGARTLFYYDKMDRKVAEIGATGTYTAYAYDGNGNVVAARVYATPSTLPTGHGGPAPQPVGSDWRETTYSYDKLNRLKTTTIANVRSGAWNAQSQSWATSGYAITTAVDYDANGNVIKSIDANNNAAYFYYDRNNRKIAHIDHGKFLTTWEHDAEGNVLREDRWPTAVSIAVTAQSDLATLRAHASGEGERITLFAYDRNGRRTGETRLLVYNHALTPEGQLGTYTIDSTIGYEYNGLGQVTRKTYATGDEVSYAYDAVGRLTEEYRSAFQDHSGAAANQPGATVTPTTLYRYNGVNNLAMSKQGGGLADVTGDRYTRYTYGAGGRLAAMEDATGATYHYAYDAAGNVLLESWSRQKSDGISFVTDGVAYVRDVLGRVTSQAVATHNGTIWVKGDGKDSEYNAFGEISRRGTNGLWQEHFDYDKAGRLWRTNAGDGAWRQYGYDGNGRQTLALEAGSSSLGGISFDDALWFASQGYVTVTATKYDERGLAVATVMPGRQLGGGAAAQTLTVARSYNAFGEVASETDARGKTTQFHYNRMGRLVAKVGPQVAMTAESGGDPLLINPTERYFYDAAGRLIATRDANAELIANEQLRPTTTRRLLAGTGYDGTEAMVTAIYNPDGGVGRIYYDVFGDARVLRNELGQDELRSYDAKGRLTQQTHRGGLLTSSYGYDLLGQRITHSNSLLGAGNVERTDYDAAGRIVSHAAFGGDVTTTSYAWDPTISTPVHYTVYGGWIETTTHVNPARVQVQADGTVLDTQLKLVVKSDAFGREVWKKDLGGHEFTTGYDVTGRMVTRSTGNETLTYGWYNSGLAASVTSSAGAQSLYGYDAAGNRTLEQTTRNGAVIQNAVAQYDALGRMTQYQELGSAASPAARVDYLYDANGNIRASLAKHRELDKNGIASSAEHTQDNWYRYDTMNRLLTKGDLVDKGGLIGKIIERGTNGVDHEYNFAGQRVRTTRTVENTVSYKNPDYVPPEDPDPNDEITPDPSTGTGGNPYLTATHYGTVREDYTFHASGAIATVRIARTTYTDYQNGEWSANPLPGTGALRATYTHDAMGRVTKQEDWLGDGTNAVYDRSVIYNSKGQIDKETVFRKSGFDTLKVVTLHDHSAGTAAYALGAPVVTHVDNYKLVNGAYAIESRSISNNSYLWFDGAVQSQVSLSINGGTPAATTFSYDVWGTLVSSHVGGERARTVTFSNDLNGQALRRTETFDDTAFFGSYGAPREVWYRFAGKQLGYLGNNGTAATDYAASIESRRTGEGHGPFRGTYLPTPHANFDLSGEPITSYDQGGSGGSYTARNGDTLASVAAQLWGDSSLWYKLAEANGLSGDTALVEGQRIAVPPGIVRSGHNASTLKPYDPSEAMGDLSPAATAKSLITRPPRRNNCGFFGQILLVIVAVAVTALVAGPAAGLVSSKILGGAMAGVAGSIASQGVGLATGLQEKFSFKQVAMSGISGAASAGVGQVLGKGALAGSKFLGDVARGAATSALTQGVGVATGLQSKFDFAGIAAAGLGSGAAGAVSRALPGAATATRERSSFFNKLGGNTAGGIANAAVRSIANGTSFGDNLIAALPDVIASTIGQAISEELAADRMVRRMRRAFTELERHYEGTETPLGNIALGARGLEAQAAHRGTRISEAARDPEAMAAVDDLVLSSRSLDPAERAAGAERFLGTIGYSQRDIAESRRLAEPVIRDLSRPPEYIGLGPEENIVVNGTSPRIVVRALTRIGRFVDEHGDNRFVVGASYIIGAIAAPVSTAFFKLIDYTPGLGDAKRRIEAIIARKTMDFGVEAVQRFGVSRRDAPYVVIGGAALVGLFALGAGALRFARSLGPAARAQVFSNRGFDPPPGSRVRIPGIPENWRIVPSRDNNGVQFIDPTNRHNVVRLMPGQPNSPHPNSRAPYARWNHNGHWLDVNGNRTMDIDAAHIPANEFRFRPEIFE